MVWQGEKLKKWQVFDDEALWGAESASALPICCPIWCSWKQFSRAALSKGRFFGCGCSLAPLGGVRNPRESEYGHRRVGFRLVAERGFGHAGLNHPLQASFPD